MSFRGVPLPADRRVDRGTGQQGCRPRRFWPSCSRCGKGRRSRSHTRVGGSGESCRRSRMEESRIIGQARGRSFSVRASKFREAFRGSATRSDSLRRGFLRGWTVRTTWPMAPATEVER
jgi:hypothetical protein